MSRAPTVPTRPSKSARFEFGPASYHVTCAGIHAQLSMREFDPGGPSKINSLAGGAIRRRVKSTRFITPRNLDVYTIEEDRPNPVHLKPVCDVGYMLDARVASALHTRD